MENVALMAFCFGLLSAASLPLGAITARFWSPGNRVIAAMMAFGAGALLAALTIDLVAHALDRGHYGPLTFGALVGGLLFVGANHVVNSKGGFLRKLGTTVTYLRRSKGKAYAEVFRHLARSPVFNAVPQDGIAALASHLNRRQYAPGDCIARKGEAGNELFVVESGEISVLDAADDNIVATLGTGDIVGEISLITDQPRTATVRADSDVSVWVLQRQPFETLCADYPELRARLSEIAQGRVADLSSRHLLDEDAAKSWSKDAENALDRVVVTPTQDDVQHAAAAHHGAPMAIYLGIMLDSIPESLVIGASAIGSSVSLSLIAGLFLSNYPESFSSSLGMREQGYSHRRIFAMWFSLMVLTGIGAWIGAVFFVGAPPVMFSVIEGIAAGAMLTMIAETMLPEAYHRGGNITGFATLLGFLAAIYFSTLH